MQHSCFGKVRYILAAGLLLLFIISTTASAAAQALSVDAGMLNVRSGPGTDHRVIDQVTRNTVLTPLEQSGGWTRVVLPDGSRGWVSSNYTSAFVPERFATVDVPVLNVRSGPGTNHPVITQFSRGTAVAVLAEQDRWLRVLRPGGGEAWLAGWHTVTSNCRGYNTVTAALLNVRSGPGTNYQVIDQLSRGEKVAVLGNSGVWLRVVLQDGRTGWLSGNYTVPSSGTPDIPDRSPVAGKIIVLDPGHGGPDPGAVGVTGYFEKTVNLAVALHLASMLRDAGANVLMTRWSDWGPSLWQRVNLANSNSADIFLSIHANAHTQPSANGIETYYCPWTASSARSRVLAGHLQRQLVSTLGLQDRGVKTAGFYVIANTWMPSALVELGFLSNWSDEAFLKRSETHRRAAEALFRGLENYFR